MNRKLLQDLGLEAEAIDKIMAEHGKTVSSYQEKLDNAVQEQTSVSEKYQEAQEALKDFETLKEQQEALQSDLKAKQEALKSYEIKDKIKGAKVQDEYLDYVSFQVNKLVDDDTDFDTALGKFVESNPQFTHVEQEKTKVNTQGKMQGKAQDNLSAEIAQAMGIKTK